MSPALAGRFFTSRATWKPPERVEYLALGIHPLPQSICPALHTEQFPAEAAGHPGPGSIQSAGRTLPSFLPGIKLYGLFFLHLSGPAGPRLGSVRPADVISAEYCWAHAVDQSPHELTQSRAAAPLLFKMPQPLVSHPVHTPPPPSPWQRPSYNRESWSQRESSRLPSPVHPAASVLGQVSVLGQQDCVGKRASQWDPSTFLPRDLTPSVTPPPPAHELRGLPWTCLIPWLSSSFLCSQAPSVSFASFSNSSSVNCNLDPTLHVPLRLLTEVVSDYVSPSVVDTSHRTWHWTPVCYLLTSPLSASWPLLFPTGFSLQLLFIVFCLPFRQCHQRLFLYLLLGCPHFSPLPPHQLTLNSVVSVSVSPAQACFTL